MGTSWVRPEHSQLWSAKENPPEPPGFGELGTACWGAGASETWACLAPSNPLAAFMGPSRGQQLWTFRVLGGAGCRPWGLSRAR